MIFKNRSRMGFTVLEVLIATVILAGAMVVLNSTWGRSGLQVRKSRQMNVVSFLLKRKVAEFELQFKTERTFAEIPEEESGDFGNEFAGYTWKVETREMEFPDLSAALVGQDGGANEMLLTVVKQMTEQFSRAVKEVKVSVFYTKGEVTKEFSVTTYIVNYDQQLGLGGS